MAREQGVKEGKGHCRAWGGRRCPFGVCVRVSPAHSESLLSELEPLELLLPDSEELLLLSREGPPEGVEPDFSAGEQGRDAVTRKELKRRRRLPTAFVPYLTCRVTALLQ